MKYNIDFVGINSGCCMYIRYNEEKILIKYLNDFCLRNESANINRITLVNKDSVGHMVRELH